MNIHIVMFVFQMSGEKRKRIYLKLEFEFGLSDLSKKNDQKRKTY